jgi:hypothetical protein
MDKKIYIFDWDDNLLFMPTKIWVKKDGKIVGISSSEYRDNGRKYKLLKSKKSFIEYNDNEKFLTDVFEALSNSKYGPSYNKLIECVKNKCKFMILTARGQSESTILAGIIMILLHEFNRGNDFWFKNDFDSLKDYLKSNYIIPVSNLDVCKKYISYYRIKKIYGDIPELKKSFIDFFINEIITEYNMIEFDVKNLSIGFSDDSPSNFVGFKELAEKYGKKFNIKFVLYDSSNPNDVKKNIF